MECIDIKDVASTVLFVLSWDKNYGGKIADDGPHGTDVSSSPPTSDLHA